MTASVRQEQASVLTATAVTTVTTPAFSSNCLTGSLIEVWIIWSGSTNPSSVQDSASQTYTFRNSIFDSNDGSTLALYTLANNGSASGLTVTATWASAVGYQAIWAKEITGVTSSPYQTSGGQDQVAPGTGSGAISSGNVTPTSQPALISCLSNGDGGNASSTANSGTQGITGWTLAGSGLNPGATSSSLRVTSTTATAMTFTNATDGGTRRFLTMASVYTEALTTTTITPGAGSNSVSGNAPNRFTATNTVIQTFVARRGGQILEPDHRIWQPAPRKILLPSRKAA